MLFVGFETEAGFLWRMGVNTGDQKKSSEYIAGVLLDISSPTLSGPFACHLYASIQDNTISVVEGGKQAEEEGNLVRLNCMLHLTALLATNIFRDCTLFADLLHNVSTLTSFVRGRPRMKTALKKIISVAHPQHKARVLLRVIPIRMLSILANLERIVLLQPHLYDLFTTTGSSPAALRMAEYFQGLDDEAKHEFTRCRSLTRDDKFFALAEAMVQVLKPLLSLTRFLDRRNAKSRDVYAAMRHISDRVVFAAAQESQKLAASEMSTSFVFGMQQVVEIIEELWSRHQAPGHTASWLLNPRERGLVRDLALSTKPDEKKEFLAARDETLTVAKVMLQRMAMFDDSLDVESAYLQLTIELVQYVFDPKRAGFLTSTIPALSPEAWWASQTGFLARCARIIMVWPAGTGNLERSMKINDHIHSKARNSLLDANADRLTRGYVALAEQRTSPPWTDDEVDEFLHAYCEVPDGYMLELHKREETHSITVRETTAAAQGTQGVYHREYLPEVCGGEDDSDDADYEDGDDDDKFEGNDEDVAKDDGELNTEAVAVRRSARLAAFGPKYFKEAVMTILSSRAEEAVALTGVAPGTGSP
jgi:hypothetical protein